MVVQRLEEATAAVENTEAAISLIKPAKLDNFDIPVIVDSKPRYKIKNRTWSYYFTCAKIFKSWLNISFVPFTRKTLKHKKLRHMFGTGGASNRMQDTLLETKKTYL